MRSAHEGVPVAGLPLGTWRNAETPNPDAPLLPPLDLTGAQAQAPTPLPGGRGGLAAQPGPASQTAAPPPAPGPRGAPGPAADRAPIPPASIPNPVPASRDKGSLSKLLGTL